jgi:hypothetical protein
MKIIEALKKVKSNKEKIKDLQNKVSRNCAHLTHETPVYGDNTKEIISGWIQSCEDISQENVRLLCRIQHTNLNTMVPLVFEADGKETKVSKSIAEWVWRRREYATIDCNTWNQLTDRGLKEGRMNVSTGDPIDVKILRNFDPLSRDLKINLYRHEPDVIDSTLETVNAVTELLDLPNAN